MVALTGAASEPPAMLSFAAILLSQYDAGIPSTFAFSSASSSACVYTWPPSVSEVTGQSSGAEKS